MKLMKGNKNSARWWVAGTMGLAIAVMLGAAPAWAQGEKRTVFTERDFHWQGHLEGGGRRWRSSIETGELMRAALPGMRRKPKARGDTMMRRVQNTH